MIKIRTSLKRLLPLLSAALFFYTNFSFSQSLTERQVLAKMNEASMKTTSYSMDVAIDLFEKNGSTPYQTMKGTVKKDGALYYSEMMQRISLRNESFFVTVDGVKKKIIYSKNKKELTAPVADWSKMLSGLDSVLAGSKVRFLEAPNGEQSYRIEIIPTNVPSYKRMEIVVQRQTFALLQLTYFHKEDEDGMLACEKTVITYSNVKLNALIDKSIFLETRFIRKAKGGMVPAEKYASYMIVDIGEMKYE